MLYKKFQQHFHCETYIHPNPNPQIFEQIYCKDMYVFYSKLQVILLMHFGNQQLGQNILKMTYFTYFLKNSEDDGA